MAATLEILIDAKDQASGVMKGVGQASDGLSSKLGALIAVAGGVVAGFASFKTLSSAVDKTQEMGSAVSRLTRETGLSAEESSRMLFAFRRVGLTADDASRNLGIFAKQLAGVEDFETGVSKGGKKVADSLREIGIRATDAAGDIRPISQLLPELADQFQAMPAGVDKTALAMQFFGRSGKDMLPLLNLGSEGLAEMGKKADELGVTLTGKNVAAIKEFTGAQREMGEAIGGLKLQIGLVLMPVLTEMAQFFVDAQPTIHGFISNGIEVLKGAITDISTNTSFLTFLDGMRQGFRDVLDIAIEMKEKLPEALAVIGEAVGKIPGVDKLTDLLASTEAAGKNPEKVRGLGTMFAQAAAGIVAFSIAAGTLDLAINLIGNTVGAAVGLLVAIDTLTVAGIAAALPFIALIAVLAALGGAAFLIEEKTQFFSKELLPALKDLATWVETKVVPAVEEFAATELFPRLERFGDWLKSDFIPVVKHIAQVFRDDWLPVIREVGVAVGTFLLPIFDTLHDLWIGAIVPALQGAVIPALKALEGVVSEIVDWFSRHETATKVLVAVLARLAIGILLLNAPWLLVIGTIIVVLARWDDISKLFTVTIPGAIDSVITKIQELPIIGAIFTDVWNTVWTIVTTYVGLILLGVQFLFDTITNIFAFWKAVFTGDWDGAWQAIKAQGEAVWNLLSGSFGLALDAFQTVLTSKLEMLKTIGSTIADVIVEGFKAAWNAAAGVINSAIPDSIGFTVPEVDTHIPGVGKVGGQSVNISLPDPIPTLRALGGPVAAGMPYIVGEKGPEWFVPKVAGAIIPNARLATATAAGGAMPVLGGQQRERVGGGGDVHVHIGNINLGKDVTRSDVRHLADELRDVFRDDARRGR